MEKYIPKNDSDELNPIYMYYLTATDLLVAIVKKQIGPIELVRKELKKPMLLSAIRRLLVCYWMKRTRGNITRLTVPTWANRKKK